MIIVFGTQPSSGAGRPGRVVTRLDVALRTIGFHAPPMPLRVSWERKRGFWLVKLRGALHNSSQMVGWAEAFRPDSLERTPTGVDMRFLRMIPEWESLALHVEPLHVELGFVDGKARVVVRNETPALGELKQADQDLRPFILDQFAPIQRPRLTPRQRFVLHSAVDWGYYDVPRRITLEKIAQRLGIGLNTLSVVLRNAEAAVVRNFAAFDSKPKDSAKRSRVVADDDQE